MRALVVFESEFGATRALAEAVGRGIAVTSTVEVFDSRSGEPETGWTTGLDLLVVGVPTHARGLPSPVTRREALTWPSRPGSTLHSEPAAADAGVREWLQTADLAGVATAVFATRVDMPKILAGSAGPRLARAVQRARGTVFAGPQDFLVTRDGALVDHELDHAYEWGRVLAASLHDLVAAGDDR
ncbi:MAG: hypothetical protein ABI566_00365 [Pseudolysinimonas sp.]